MNGVRIYWVSAAVALAVAACVSTAEAQVTEFPVLGLSSPGLDIGPWPPTAPPRQFRPTVARPVIYTVNRTSLERVGRPIPALNQACRSRQLALPKPAARAHIGTAVFDASVGATLVGSGPWRGQIQPDRIYAFKNYDSTACSVWLLDRQKPAPTTATR